MLLAGLCGCLLLAVVSISAADAQIQNQWSEPYRLSTGRGRASGGYPIADPYGYVHVFWLETLEGSERSILFYSRFDGASWTSPLDIYFTSPFAAIENLARFVDKDGVLHLAWSEGQNGPMYYTNVPIVNALSAQHWQVPQRINVPAKQVELVIDGEGTFHVLYTRTFGHARGIFYIRSHDQGATWSDPRWLDPDILPGFTAGSLQLRIDPNEGLHAAWYYAGVEAQGADWVRYAHSFDRGQTWTLPITLDRVVPGSEEDLDHAGPIMEIQGERVHVMWAGGSLPYRKYRYSDDRGQTWSAPTRIFDNLHGQAGDGFALDGLGRVHFFGQIRYPQGIYHAIMETNRWTRPSLIYLVSLSAQDPIGDRIHAHLTRPAIRAGNQLVLTFADSPSVAQRRLFVTYRTLPDVAPSVAPAPTRPMPALTRVATRESLATSTQSAGAPAAIVTAGPPTAAAGGEAIAMLPAPSDARPDQAIWLGLIPPLLMLGVMVIYRLLFRHRRTTTRYR
jgi:hypothetical protein